MLPKLFKVFNSVARLNEKIGVNLTHHDINWVYSCHDSKGMRLWGFIFKLGSPRLGWNLVFLKLTRAWTRD